MPSAVVIFPESDSFVGSLSRWLHPPAAAAPADGGEPAAPVPSAFETECEALNKQGDKTKLAAKMQSALLEKLLSGSVKEADARNAFGLYLELLVQWQLLAQQATPIASELAAKPDASPELKGSLLLHLYSLVQQQCKLELRFSLLLTLIGFCTASKQLPKVLGPAEQRFERVERWVAEWELGSDAQKQLWAIVFDAHAAEDLLFYECSLKYLSLFAAADFASAAGLKERIVQALLVAIRSPELFRCDELSQLPVVGQLKSDAKFAPLYALLQIVARDTYAEFLAFAGEKSNAAFMEAHSLQVGACGDKMRLLTIVSLGHATKELSYAEVAKALRVEQTEVEEWLMRGIGAGLITAKMDQVREVVAVSMCAERDFGMRQWEKLHGSLVEWRDSIHTLLDVVQKSLA